MAVLLIDYENVHAMDGLKGVEYLNKKDTLIIFYSQCCEKIRSEYLEAIEQSKCEFRIYKLLKSGKNALDFYIAAECGWISQSGEKQIAIISRDKGFSAVCDFFQMKEEDIMVTVASNIENGLASLNEPEDILRRRTIKNKAKPMDIASAQARIKERKEFVDKIMSAFADTKFEMRTTEILEFMEERRESTPKLLYTSSLHKFGRKDGREIYQILKSAI